MEMAGWRDDATEQPDTDGQMGSFKSLLLDGIGEDEKLRDCCRGVIPHKKG